MVHTSGAIESATPKMFVWFLTLLFLKLWFLKGIKKNIAQKAYCSGDIYFQFKEVRRSFISHAIGEKKLVKQRSQKKCFTALV